MSQSKKSFSVGFLYDDSLDSHDGVSQYVKTLGEWLSTRGHRVTYLVGDTKLKSWHGGEVVSMAHNIGVSFNQNRLSVPLPTTKRNLKSKLAGRIFDLVHVQVPYSPFMSMRVINMLPKETAIVGTFHIYPAGQAANLGSKVLGTISRKNLHKFSQVVAVSQPAADFARKSYDIDCQIVPNAVDVTRYNHSIHKPSREPKYHIVFIGRLVERKGCLLLLKAFGKLRHNLPDSRLTIAGDGPQMGRLTSFVRDNNLESSVEFKGYVSEKQKAELLSNADIACFPSLSGESFGIVLIEAMAAGTAVVLGGDNPGYRSVLGGFPKLLIDSTDTANFANRLSELLQNEDLKQSALSWQQAQLSKYDIRLVGPKIEAIYTHAIANAIKKDHN